MVAAEIAFRFGSRHTVPSLLQIRGGGRLDYGAKRYMKH